MPFMVLERNIGHRKWPNVIKLKARVKNRPLLHTKGLAQFQGECDNSAQEKRDRRDEVKRQSEEMKWDDIWGREDVCSVIENGCLSK